MTSNRPLNSKEALEESTATSSSVMLSGARREKISLDINDCRRNPGNSQPGKTIDEKSERKKADQSEVFTMRMTSAIASGLKSDSKLGELDDECVMVF